MGSNFIKNSIAAKKRLKAIKYSSPSYNANSIKPRNYADEAYEEYFQNFTKEDVFHSPTLWIQTQPESERVELQKYFLSGMYKLDKGSKKTDSFTGFMPLCCADRCKVDGVNTVKWEVLS